MTTATASQYTQQQNVNGNIGQNDLSGQQVVGRPRTSGIAVRGSATVMNPQQANSVNTSSNLYGINNMSAQSDANGTKNNLGSMGVGTGNMSMNRITLQNQNQNSKKQNQQVFQQSNGALHIMGMQGGANGNASQTMNNSFVGTMQRPQGMASGVQGVLRGRGSSDNTQIGNNQQPVFYQMNNNFMIVNIVNGNGTGTNASSTSNQAGNNVTGIQSGVGSVALGQKTAYGFVGGINGQGLATVTSQSNLINNVKNGYGTSQQQQKGNRNMSSKRVLNNGLMETQNASQGQSAGYKQILVDQPNQMNDSSLPLNKRVLSANRANSLNASNGGGSQTGPTVIIQNGANNNNNTNLNNHLAQQFSMQQRRRHQNTFSNKIVHNNNFTGNAGNGSSYGNSGIIRTGQQLSNNSNQMNQQVQSSSQANFVHINSSGQKGNQNSQKTGKIGIKNLQGQMMTSQSFQRGVGGSASGQQPSAQDAQGANTALSTDDGFLRGARIAEKIQEYYHSNNSGPHNLNLINQKAGGGHQSNINLQNQANGNIIKSYVGAATKAKQIRNQKAGGNFKITNIKNGPQPWQSNHQGTAANRITRTSHGTNGMRGRVAGSHAPIGNQGNKGFATGLDNAAMLHATQTDPSQTANNDIITGAFKGRASSSYGSLQSRTNAVVSSGSIVKQHQNAQLNLNKSGISATSGILNYSNYNSNGTMISNGPASANLQGTLSKYYQDSSNQFTVGAGANNNGTVTSNTLSSNMDRGGGLVVPHSQGSAHHSNVIITNQAANVHHQQHISAQNLNSLRPITRDVKLRSQANRNNTSNAMPGSLSQASQKGSQIQNNYNSQAKTNFAGGGLNTSSALSGNENFDGKRSFNGPAGGSNAEARTFQNTINIGSFINEINKQNQIQKVQSNPRTELAGQATANQHQSDSLGNFNNHGVGVSQSNVFQLNHEQVGIKAGAATTFSNTIDNTEVSLEDGIKASGAPGHNQDTILNAGGANEGQHRLIQENETFDKNDTADKFNLDQLHTNSGGNDPGSTEQRKNANNQQIQEATHQYNASATTVIDNSATQGTDEKLGQQLRHLYNSAPAKDQNGKSSEINPPQGEIMFIQDSPEHKRAENMTGPDEEAGEVNRAVDMIDQSDEPMIKIHNQNNQGQRQQQKALQQYNNQGGISSSDIRQIKLNYIQLNKRATTASNNGMGRKIPQKGQTGQAVGAVSGSGLQTQTAAGSQPQLAGDGQQQPVGKNVREQLSMKMNQNQNFAQNAYNQYGGNAYQDGVQRGGITNNWTHGGARMQPASQTQQQFSSANTQSQPQVMTSQHIQNQYRQLQTRQTRRIINANAQNPNGAHGQPALPNEQRNAYQTEPQQPIQLGRGQEFVHQHIVQQQQNLNQAHLAQTHALAYHVEKYQQDGGDGDGGTHAQNQHAQQSQQEQNQFCTEGSHIENIDNYIIGKRIGQGAYAVVRVGLHKILNQKIAVKIYEKFKLLEPNRRKSVKREIKIMEKIDHECLAKLYEAFESHKQVFLIMEYVNGGSLHGYLKGKPNRQMAEIEAKYLWQQVVFGIHYLHQRNVTHRDIKLENILLDETRTRVKLIDFGFSTCIPHDKKVKIFCGTPSYMAPEIVSKIEYAGPPADIWALGVLLYALLCGRFPFKGQNDKELYTNICKQELPLQDHISRQGRQLLLRIFHKNPDKRPSTKDILRDPWLQFSTRDQEMMSPKSLAFIAYLKKISNINFGLQSQQNNKLGMNKTVTGGFSRSSNGLNRNDFTDVQSSASFHIQSKDKRNQLHASDVKQFILDDNGRKNYLMAQKKQTQSIGSDIGSMNHSNLVPLTGQSVGGNQHNQQYQKGSDCPRYNLNNTMPVGGIATESLNMMRQTSIENGIKLENGVMMSENQMIAKAVTSPDHARENIISGNQAILTNESKKPPSNKINMEAYQAYYNTNDSCQGPGQAGTQSGTGNVNNHVYEENQDPPSQANNTNLAAE